MVSTSSPLGLRPLAGRDLSSLDGLNHMPLQRMKERWPRPGVGLLLLREVLVAVDGGEEGEAIDILECIREWPPNTGQEIEQEL